MNELLMRRCIKQLISRGVPKYLAVEMSEVAMEASKGVNVEIYIDYAMRLVYGLKISKNVK